MPRGERDKVAREMLEAGCAGFEHYLLRLPMQWFNFYDFFGDGLRALGREADA